MKDIQHSVPQWLIYFFTKTRELLNLRADTDEVRTVEYIRANVDFKSANAWTLIFAIFIASVGLNTNSSAVIIGAMLISPLMGPIVGAGLGLGINDMQLIKRALRNLAYAIGISLLTSTLYFLISPISEVQSELLARTRPTFFDVMIAVFGGAAGIIAVSRPEKGNAVPGVAIATALMPPLCTAGFGLAVGELSYFFGALYLFVINSVFICTSTFVFVRYLRFKKVVTADAETQKKVDRWILCVVTIVVVPSLLFAWLLQRENSFQARAKSFIAKELKFDQAYVVDREIFYSWSEPKVKVSLIGEPISQSEIAILHEKMKSYGLKPDVLEIRQTSFAENVEKRISDKFNTQNESVRQNELQAAQISLELQRYKTNAELAQKVSTEVALLFPKITRIGIEERSSGTDDGEKTKIVDVFWQAKPSKLERAKISEFLNQRIDGNKKVIGHALGI